MVNDAIVRTIRESDAQQVYVVALEAWQYTYHSIFDQQFIVDFVNQNYAPQTTLSMFPQLQAGTMCFYVAEHDSKVIGFCNIGIRVPSAELHRIYVLPAYIGQRIGQKLLQAGERFLMEHSVYRYFCFVHKNNDLGKRFYSRAGFRHHPTKDQNDEWYMEKSISIK